MLALFLGTFVSEDLACLSAGSLAASGRIDIASAIGTCFLGILVGDFLLYGLGRGLSPGLAAWFISQERMDQGARWINERGTSAIFMSRFTSGLRLPTYLAAGALRMDAKRFALYLALAGAIWTPMLVLSGSIFHGAVPGGAVFGLVGGFLAVRFGFRMTDWKTRRMFVGRLRRLSRWEFWPLWVFYVPVVM